MCQPCLMHWQTCSRQTANVYTHTHNAYVHVARCTVRPRYPSPHYIHIYSPISVFHSRHLFASCRISFCLVSRFSSLVFFSPAPIISCSLSPVPFFVTVIVQIISAIWYHAICVYNVRTNCTCLLHTQNNATGRNENSDSTIWHNVCMCVCVLS